MKRKTNKIERALMPANNNDNKKCNITKKEMKILKCRAWIECLFIISVKKKNGKKLKQQTNKKYTIYFDIF